MTDCAWDDLSIEREVLDRAGADLVLAPAGDEATLCRLAAGADAILNNWARVSPAVIDAAPACQIISRMGIGLDSIDVAYATTRGIPVTNVPDYCIIEVAEHALALLLACARNVAYQHLATKQGSYQLLAGPTLRRIEGRTLGIMGFGGIGRQLAQRAAGLGLRILATSRSRRDPQPGVAYVDLDELLAESDFISLHVPLTAETRHMIGAAQLARMRPTTWLINTSRGPLIDHQALAAALAADRLAGAALDVQEPEPPDLSQAPFNDSRVIVTPHIAFVSAESLLDLRQRSSGQVAERLAGRIPPHVVNPQVFERSSK
jgi:D-3-phosphoglycerate dehydrogenase / 2-oxoglutarate reductase